MKKGLIIKLSAIGDISLALPQVSFICRHHAGDAIWQMTAGSEAAPRPAIAGHYDTYTLQPLPQRALPTE